MHATYKGSIVGVVFVLVSLHGHHRSGETAQRAYAVFERSGIAVVGVYVVSSGG
jgi:uncharacterized YccA/Bax inhibitor family protein